MTTLTAEMVRTCPVLAGAYRGKDLEARALLTHLVRNENNEAVCRKGINICPDESESTNDRPTCPTCAKRWDRIHGGK